MYKSTTTPHKFTLSITVRTVYDYSYIVHIDAEIGGVGYGGPGHVVQQVDLHGASAAAVVADLICCSIGIDQLNGLSLLERDGNFREINNNRQFAVLLCTTTNVKTHRFCYRNCIAFQVSSGTHMPSCGFCIKT